MTDSTPKHPGRILFDQVMTPLGVSRNKLARDIDVPVGRISDIVAGKRGVTPDTALRFAKYFGTTAELWLRLQADYDLYVARTTTWPDAEPKVASFEPAAGAAPDAAPPVKAADPLDVTPEHPAIEDVEPGAGENVAAEPVAAEPELINDAAAVDPEDADIDIPEPAGVPGARPEGL